LVAFEPLPLSLLLLDAAVEELLLLLSLLFSVELLAVWLFGLFKGLETYSRCDVSSPAKFLRQTGHVPCYYLQFNSEIKVKITLIKLDS
jgi:hypothetical protein